MRRQHQYFVRSRRFSCIFLRYVYQFTMSLPLYRLHGTMRFQRYCTHRY